MNTPQPTLLDVLMLLRDIERRVIRVETRMCILFEVLGRIDEIDTAHKASHQ